MRFSNFDYSNRMNDVFPIFPKLNEYSPILKATRLKKQKNIFLDRNALNHGFDLVFYLTEDQNTAHLKLEDFAKLYSLLALKSFDNCAYVCPSMLALKNCDDIFSTETDGLTMVEGDEKASVFLFKPSVNHFVTITTGLKKSMINGMQQFW